MLGMIGTPQAHAQQGAPVSGGNLLTVIIIDFANKSGIGGDALGRFATDAVAVEMASSARFEVLKRDEVIRTANDLGYRMPFDQAQLTKIATTLGANAVVTGEVAFVKPVAK
jgi:curli biogenesis system outer membrane secretion channel CsgG